VLTVGDMDSRPQLGNWLILFQTTAIANVFALLAYSWHFSSGALAHCSDCNYIPRMMALPFVYVI
jgi:hypothetical protein